MNNNIMPYLLISAKQLRINGYTRISMQMVRKLEEELYGSNSVKLNKKLHKMYDDSDIIGLKMYTDTFVHTQEYLLDSSNALIRVIYLNGLTNSDYAEVGFMLCVLGLVNTRDYLANNRNINAFVDRFELVSKRKFASDMSMTGSMFYDIMSLYLYNMSMGIKYGYSPYDLLYHMSKKFKMNLVNMDYRRAVGSFVSLKLKDYSIFNLSKEILDKYIDEVGLMLPMLVSRGIVNNNDICKILVRLPALLVSAILENPVFILATERNCIFTKVL